MKKSFLKTCIALSLVLGWTSPCLNAQSASLDLVNLPKLPALGDKKPSSRADQARLTQLAKQYQGNVPSLPGLPGSKATKPVANKKTTKPSLQAAPSTSGSSFSAKKMTKEERNEKAFELLKERALPLNPGQILELRKSLDKTQRAVATPAAPPPVPMSSSLVVDLSPGVTPPIIRLSAGFISTLVFVDATGQPWPITGYGIGDPVTFNLQWDGTSHILMVQSLKAYANGNLAVRLKGLDTPIILTLVTAQKQVDYRVDLRVKGRGPNALPPVLTDTVRGTAKIALINMLDGIPPEGSLKLTVSGDEDGTAWLKGDKMYYRTRLTLLSPAWESTLASPDGTKVYELRPYTLILGSKNGKTRKIHLSGF